MNNYFSILYHTELYFIEGLLPFLHVVEKQEMHK